MKAAWMEPIESIEGADARRHSALAMEAARRMRGARGKRKNAQMVCHHLRMMLAAGGQGLAAPAAGLPGGLFALGLPAQGACPSGQPPRLPRAGASQFQLELSG